jgi:hypothetical protein
MQIPQLVQQELAQYQRDAHYFDEHRGELLAQYPEHWVAIYHQQVVGVAKDPWNARALNRVKSIASI